MRRSERVTAWIGAVLVAATSATAIGVLVAQGGRPVVAARESSLIPADLMWVVFDACTAGGDVLGESAAAIGVREDGTLSVDVESSSAPDQVAAYEERVNRCLANYPLEGPALFRSSGRVIDTAAERLLAYEVARRWLVPCLVHHGAFAGEVPGIADYLDEDQAPWYAYYRLYSDIDLDGVIAARRACGAGTQPYDF